MEIDRQALFEAAALQAVLESRRDTLETDQPATYVANRLANDGAVALAAAVGRELELQLASNRGSTQDAALLDEKE